MIELKEVKKIYGNTGLGLNKESISFYDGEIVGLLGENGSGKTTLLKAIMGLCEINEGEIIIDRKPVYKQYHKMSFITEEGSYLTYMTPYDYGEFLMDFIPGFNKNRYNMLLEFFDLDKYKKIKSFSKGQKSKVEVSAGFSKGAKYILMDEPFLGKDLFTRRDFLKLIASSLKDDETIILSTHLVDEIENFIDRAVILRYGRIKADFYIDEIRDKDESLSSIMMNIAKYDKNKYKDLLK